MGDLLFRSPFFLVLASSDMDFIDQIHAIAAKVEKQLPHIQTEEATKTALIMPFIGALGYDVFDPSEVTPELNADVGVKKGEKVDYAIMRDGRPTILFECKSTHTNLDEVHASQLYRYFSVTEARIGVLTNGVTYRFFSDLEEKNKMDERPFLEFHMLDIHEPLIAELKKLTKSSFDMDEMIEVAGELKYTRAIKKLLAQQMSEPTEDFIRFFAGQVYSGRITQKVREQFKPVIKRAIRQFITEKVNYRLQSAIQQEGPTEEPVSPPETEETESVEIEEGIVYRDEESGIVTTEDEMEAFRIVKAIASEVVEPSRVVHRDVKSYFSVLLDDNNRKPICRFRFHREQYQIGVIDENKDEERIPIDNLNEIYSHADQIRETIRMYEKDQ